MNEIRVLTGNTWKFKVAREALAGFGIVAVQETRQVPEIQADTSAEIARHAAIAAARELGEPVIREDHSLFIGALGIPGPYTQFVERALPAETLSRILSLFPDRTGAFEVALAYAEPSGRVEECSFRVPVVFASEPRGKLSGGWDRLLMLYGENRTFAEYPESERREIWSANFRALACRLQGRANDKLFHAPGI
jgi:non-canonical purine NTP pyrophosphatase (RdgB/HAM1 family)